MESQSLAPLIGFLIPYVAARQLLAAAVARLPAEDKVMLVDVAARGRRYLWVYASGLIAVQILFEGAFVFVLVALLIAMICYNHWWVRSSSLPQWYKSRHLLCCVLSIASFFVAYLSWYVARSMAL